MSDPVRLGLVASLSRLGGNVTGLTTISPEFSPKRLELLREVLPGISRAALLWNAANAGHSMIVRELEVASQQLGIHLQVLGVQGSEPDFEQALDTVASEGANALFVIDDLVIAAHQTRILDWAAQRRLPVISQFREFAEMRCSAVPLCSWTRS